MAHLTCVNATRGADAGGLEQTRALGIKNVLALRGDPPIGSEFAKTETASSTPTNWSGSFARPVIFPSASPGFRRGTWPARKASTLTGTG